MKYIFLMFLTAVQVRAEVKPFMQNFYNLTEKLQPYLVDKSAFMKEENEKEIATLLTEFNQNTQNLKKDKLSKNDDMKFRVKLLTEDLDEAESSFKNGFKDYSYWALKSSLNNCMSCHTQKGLPFTTYKLKDNGKGDLFSQAEFLFTVRNYPESLPMYEQLLINYPDNKASIEKIDMAAQKILFYAIRVSRNDENTLEQFDRILKNMNLPEDIRTDIIAWRKYINVRKYRIDETQAITTEKQLEKFRLAREKIAEEYKRPRQRAAADLDTAHFLYQLLEKNDNKMLKPSILYSLAEIESDYRISFFDQTSDNYLKECIEKYSRRPVAKKCYALYKDLQIISYSGSRGTDLPLAVKRQLEKYELMVNKK